MTRLVDVLCPRCGGEEYLETDAGTMAVCPRCGGRGSVRSLVVEEAVS